MRALIDDLLDYTRLSHRPLNPSSVDSNKLVQSALEDLGYPFSDRKVTLRLGELPVCKGDPSLLKQVWLNLLSNALKYTRRRDRALVEVGCEVGIEENVFFVRDNGAGFDMRYAEKLFGVFQRLHQPEDYEGTGVGLAVVQRIVHRHGGRVWAEAVVDQGATFHVALAKEPAA